MLEAPFRLPCKRLDNIIFFSTLPYLFWGLTGQIKLSMRIFLSFVLFISALNYLTAQSVSKQSCYAEKLLQKQIEKNPEYYQQQEKNVQKFIANYKPSRFKDNGTPIITIPVVVHVVYNPTQEGSNLSEDLIHFQIWILNESFRRLNGDTGNLEDIFKPLGADIEIEFCLATIDPDGNPTNGITRTASYLNYNPQTFDGYVKHSETGGADAWPADKYLNIWSCDMSLVVTQYVIGYATFPGGDPSEDGVVIAWPFFGRTDSPSTAPNNLGRTCVHEVGHWLGLRHIWGDGDCSATDFVEDTPKADGAHQGDCARGANTCSNEDSFWAGVDPPDMVENYMDYSGDNCMNIFTLGQKTRMLGFLYTDSLRAALFNSDKCRVGPDGINENIGSWVAVSPNPVKETLSLSSAEMIKDLSIVQVDGKQIVQIQEINTHKVTVPLPYLEKGIYLVYYRTVSENTGMLRFIKD